MNTLTQRFFVAICAFAPALSFAEGGLPSDQIMACARQAHLISKKEVDGCFALADEADGSTTLYSKCTKDGVPTALAWFSKQTDKVGFETAQQSWRPCP